MAFNISQLQELVADGKTGEAMKILMENSQTVRSVKLRNEILQLSSRWKNHQSTYRKGTQNQEQLGVEQRRIDDALLSLLSAIEEGQQGRGESRRSKVNKWQRYAAICVAVIIVLAGIYKITGDSSSDLGEKEPLQTNENLQPENERPSSIEPTKNIDETPELPPDHPTKTTETTPPPSPNKLTIETKTNKGSGSATFKSGETMRAYYRVNKPCLLRVIYQLADGRLILFENDRQITQEQVNKYIELGDGYEPAEPFGNEQLFFFVQTEPFPKLTTELSEDGYLEIKEGLENSLRKTRGMKKKVYLAESKLEIVTKQ
ncbi:MAG: hypothetical protein AAFZ15_04775 [Bacteroidota bacterium]